MPGNQLLRTAIREAGWTFAKTAEEVNAVGAEVGLKLYYDRTSVGHWVAGTIPRKDTIPCVVAAFTRRLGRPMSPRLLGWPDTDAADPWAGEVLMRLTQIGQHDMLGRRSVLTTGLYSLAALAVPTAPAPRSATGGAAAAQQVRDTTRHLADLDDLYGGGAARAAVAAYLTRHVVPQLHAASAIAARPAMFAAASECTYLAGWMAADDMCSALAQRYYVQAIRLADEAGDPIARARVLRGLSLQALELGHSSEALAVADAALDAIRGGCPARTRAWIVGMRAEALAAVGRSREARSDLRTAERLLEAADSPPKNEWTGNYRRESWQHQAGTLLARLRDPEAETHLAASLASRRTVERRTRALIGVRLAVLQRRRSAANEAQHTLAQIRDDLDVSSARVRFVLAQIQQR
ncbi:Tat pathway signal protein [Actinoallomurus liliacearum]|uniref:Tat pathway signal protein n=1 Tax=Actinoallomurus liliacearum TaxID=1080073 RepID=A0ABP8TNQ1_9ACTN